MNCGEFIEPPSNEAVSASPNTRCSPSSLYVPPPACPCPSRCRVFCEFLLAVSVFASHLLLLANSLQKLHDNSINDYAEPRSAAGLPANAVIDSNSEPAGNQRNCPY